MYALFQKWNIRTYGFGIVSQQERDPYFANVKFPAYLKITVAEILSFSPVIFYVFCRGTLEEVSSYFTIGLRGGTWM